MILSILASGLGAGALYGLVALGYFLFFRATTAINFAIGAYVMFAGMTMAHAVSQLAMPWIVAAAAGIVGAIVLVWIAEAVILRPIMARSTDEFGAVVAIVALMFVIEQLAGVLFGKRPIAAPTLFGDVYNVADNVIEARFLWSPLIAICVFTAVWAWLKFGRYGRMLRAVGDNEGAARVLGLPIRRVKLGAVIATGLVCGVAGIMQISQTPFNFHSHLAFAVTGFIAFVIGGTGSAWAALVGGLVLGIIEALSIWFLGGGARDYVLLVLVLLIFSVRPEGIFTVRVRA